MSLFCRDMVCTYLGYPTIEGKAVEGASFPEKPALQTPEPLSITTGTPFYEVIRKYYTKKSS